MDNYKLVMISIFFSFLKHEKDATFCFFYENTFGKILGFGYMHENKTFCFCFLKKEINFKRFEIFFNFQKKIRNVLEKTKYFNTGYISYSVNIQPDIMQNWWENM